MIIGIHRMRSITCIIRNVLASTKYLMKKEIIMKTFSKLEEKTILYI